MDHSFTNAIIQSSHTFLDVNSSKYSSATASSKYLQLCYILPLSVGCGHSQTKANVPSIAKATNWSASVTKWTEKGTNSTANGTKSTVKVINSIAKPCKTDNAFLWGMVHLIVNGQH